MGGSFPLVIYLLPMAIKYEQSEICYEKIIIIIIILQASEFDCPLINSFSVSIIIKFCNKLLLLFSYFYQNTISQKFNKISVLALLLSLVYFNQIQATVLTTILE